MNEIKHSPGPWEVDSTGYRAEDNGLCVMAGDLCVAVVLCDNDKPQEHNARVIAASPDALLALEMIAAEDDAAWQRTKRPLLTSGVRAMLDAALIKAGRKEAPKRSPRFENVSCSGCGQDFGPGDEGFSSCKDHADRRVRHIRICGDGL